MSKVLTKVVCPHCDSANIKKNGIKPTGKQNFYCKGRHRQFQQIYKYQGANPILKKQVCEMAMCASGVRDIAKVLKMSAVTVILSFVCGLNLMKNLVLKVYLRKLSLTKCGVG